MANWQNITYMAKITCEKKLCKNHMWQILHMAKVTYGKCLAATKATYMYTENCQCMEISLGSGCNVGTFLAVVGV